MSTGEYVIALTVSVVIAFIGFPFNSYQCWWSWTPIKTVVGTGLYLASVGLGGGFVGITIAALSNASLTPNGVVNAILLGAVGALLLRSDVRPRGRVDDVKTERPVDYKQAASIVGALVTYTSASLDTLTKREAERWYTSLDDVQLARQSLRLRSDVENRSDCTKPFKEKTSQRVVEEIENLSKEDCRDAARAHLVLFCTDYVASRRIAKIAAIK